MTFWTDHTVTIAGVTYNTFDPDARDTLPTVYAPLPIQWGQPTGLDAPEPDQATIDLSVPAGGTWPTLLDTVIVTAHRGSYSGTLFNGAVDALRRTSRVMRSRDGSTFVVDVLRISAVSWQGIAARRKIGDEPWPLESAAARLQRIAALTPELPWNGLPNPASPHPLTYANVAPRDVDNTSALELVEATINGADWVLVANDAGLTVQARSTSAPDVLVIPDSTGVAYVSQGTSTTARPLSADYILDADRVLDYDGILNLSRTTYKVPDDDNPGDYRETTETASNPESIQQWSEAGHSASTDDVDPAALLRAGRWAVLAGTPRWRLDGDVELLIDDAASSAWDTGAVSLLTWLGTRVGGCLVIGDAPEEDLRTVRVIGGNLTLGAAADESLTLTTEPWIIGGAGGPSFNNMDVTLDSGGTTDQPVTFAEVQQVTFADLALVDAQPIREP